MYFLSDDKNCTGCTACKSICPVQCIEMKINQEGFWIPEASEKCVHCGKCARVCPIARLDDAGITDNKQMHKSYAAVSNSSSIWRRSSSGGAFSEICRVWGDHNTLYSGAIWSGLDVKHTCVIGFDHIAPLCRSKYVASEVGDVFIRIKKHLESGQYALFCGTPCQVAGLRSYLGKDYEKLLLIDLICHGVGSPAVFKTCIKLLEEQFKGTVSSYEFRVKRKVYQSDYIQLIKVDGKEIYIKNDPYIQLFLSQLCLRSSCGENCRFRTENREGDITIADFKGLTKVFPNLIGEKKNYSSIIFNTDKGCSIISKIEKYMSLLPCDIEDIKKYNPLFYRHTYSAKNRDKFFKNYIASPVDLVKNQTTLANVDRGTVKSKVFSLLPIKVRKWLIYIIHYGQVS